MKQFFLSLIISTVPIFLLLYNNKIKVVNSKRSLIYSLIISLITFFLTIMISHYNYSEYGITGTLCGSLFSIVLNYQQLSDKINLKKIPKLCGVLSLFFIIPLVGLILIEINNWDIDNLTSYQEIIVDIFGNIFLALVLFFIYFKDLINDFKIFINEKKKNFIDCIIFWILGLVSMIFLNFLINIFIPKAIANNEELVQSQILAQPALMFFSAGILAPFVEEICFRKTFIDVFKNKWFCIFISGLIFGLLHVVFSFKTIYDFAYVLPYGALGACFCTADLKNNNIISSIVIHMIHNIFLLILSISSLGMI